MVRSLVSSNKSNVNGHKNTVLQDCSIDTMLVSSGSDIIDLLGNLGKYDLIQEIMRDQHRRVAKQHPLFPEFTAKYNSDLEKLISNPETEEALKKYPRRVKGSVKFDFTKYPYMNENETIGEYIYRTQTELELETTAYKEYLGDEPDPYPRMIYSDGMITTVKPPKFPEAIEASIVSGDISVPVMLRRLPCMEYGKMVIGTVSDWQSFDLTVTLEGDFTKEIKASSVSITKKAGADLSTLLLREKLIKNIAEKRSIQIFVDGDIVMEGALSEEELNVDIFKNAPIFCDYIEKLIYIEKSVGCSFETEIKEILIDDYNIASIVSASLEDKWLITRLDFDNTIRCPYDKIPKELTEGQDKNEIGMTMKDITFSLLGIPFFADKLIIVYTEAKVNNVKSIIKNVKRKRENILVTVKPKDGMDKLVKYVKMEGIRMDK